MSLNYATFQPGCLRLTVEDLDDASRTETTDVKVVSGVRSDTRTVAVLGRAGWSRKLRLTATAHERSCSGPLVARQSVEAEVPVEGVTNTTLDLRADDRDSDTYVAATGEFPGTDCNDERADVYPQATEICDDVDNNCVNGQTDAVDLKEFYPDGDEDGYGDPNGMAVRSCDRPVKTATQLGDCNDGDPSIRPGQQESRCDGVDEDCDGMKDDDAFAVGASCSTPLGCMGANVCQSVSSAVCVSSETPVPWYVDEDGDGSTGLQTTPNRCTAPSPGASAMKNDCDESSRYVANSSTLEVCDRLDNDCDGQKDEGLTGCSSAQWHSDTVGTGSAQWNAVAPYTIERGWLAGESNRVMYVYINNYTPVADCPGNWKSAWAASNGRVFLGSDGGKLATATPDALATCTQVDGPGSASINGMVGFEQGSTVRLFAVDSQGRVIRWEYVEGAPSQAAPEVVIRIVSANLRAIHGLNPETLLVVGAEEDVSGTAFPAAWRAPASGSTWQKETLGIPGTTTGSLRAVRVLTPGFAYVAGDKGLLLERAGTTWATKPSLTVSGTAVDLRSMLAFGRTAIYAVTSGSRDIRFFDGTSWGSVNTPPNQLNALAATGPGDIWATGDNGTFVHWRP